MTGSVASKPVIGISACLLGRPVRYDGRALDATPAFRPGRDEVVLVPVCPECMAGLGVPRPPIRLTGSGDEVLDGSARVVDEEGRDVTVRVVGGAQACLEVLERAGAEAVVLKERSPSCGRDMAPAGEGDERGTGVFAALCERAGLLVLTEDDVSDDAAWRETRRRLGARATDPVHDGKRIAGCREDVPD